MKQLQRHSIPLLLILTIMLLFAFPAVAGQSGTESPLNFADVEKVWKFSPDQLAVLQEAFKQRGKSEIVAMHVTGLPGFTLNEVDEDWHFTWKGMRLAISGGNEFARMMRDDTASNVRGLSYEVTTAGGKLLFTWKDENEGGRELQWLCVPEGDGLVAEVSDYQDKRTHKVFEHLSPPFGDPMGKIGVNKLVTGQRFSWSRFDAHAVEIRKCTAVISKKRVKPDPTFPWVVQVDTTGDGEHSTVYLDAKKAPVRVIVGAFTLVPCPLAIALAEREKAVAGQINIETPLDCWIPQGEPLSSLTLHLSARCNGDTFLARNARQTVRKVPYTINEYRVTTLPETPPSATELAREIPAADTNILRALEPTNEFESGAREIQQAARRVVRSEHNRFKQVLLLTDWVSEYVHWSEGAPGRTALETLRTRRADCTGFAALLVALARALDIPARRIGGWKVTQNSCAGHAWAEVYLGRWVQIDPTMGQMVDATYIQQSENDFGLLNWAKVEAIGVHGKVTGIDKARPAWSKQGGLYRNRLLGLAMAIPADAKFVAPVGEKRVEAQQGEIPPGKVTPFLFSISRPVQGADPEAVAVFISEGNDAEVDARMYLDEAVKLTGYSSLLAYSRGHGALFEAYVFQHAGRTFAAKPLRYPDGKHATLYVTNLNDGLALGFIYTGAMVDNLHGMPLPPIIVDLMDSLKHTKPDLGAQSTNK